jgi:hypothetical protein
MHGARFRTVVDIGGGTGTLLTAILRANEEVNGLACKVSFLGRAFENLMRRRRNRARSTDRSAFPEWLGSFAPRLFTRKTNVFQQMIVQLDQRPSLAAAHDPNGYCPD